MSVANGMYRYNIARVADDNPNPKYKRSHSQMIERSKLLEKVERMGELPYRPSLRLTKEDTDTLWKDFLSLRPKLLIDNSCCPIFRMLCCKSNCCSRREDIWENSDLHGQTLLKAAQIRMDKELDIVTIMRTNRYLRLLIHSLLSRKARSLLKNQQS